MIESLIAKLFENTGLGVAEVKNTINRIRYIFQKEQEVKNLLKQLSNVHD